MERLRTIIPPQMPDYAYYESQPLPRQAGFNPENNQIPIETFTEDEAKEYAEMMKNEFIAHWRKKQKTGKNGN
jgi:hypothetical protein